MGCGKFSMYQTCRNLWALLASLTLQLLFVEAGANSYKRVLIDALCMFIRGFNRGNEDLHSKLCRSHTAENSAII
jgi:hypothetical protein